MKRYLKIIILLFSVFFLATYSAMAIPFSSSGHVDPDYYDSWNPSLSATALFELSIATDGPNVYVAGLAFQNDIFDFTGISSSNFTVINPDGWNTALLSTPFGYELSLSIAGTPATANDPIQILFDYTLLSADRFYQASGTDLNGVDWAWNTGQTWEIPYSLSDGNPFNGLVDSWGTATPSPEPATMLLLGTGLAGMVAMVRRRKVRKA